jgi:hypothetical protein
MTSPKPAGTDAMREALQHLERLSPLMLSAVVDEAMWKAYQAARRVLQEAIDSTKEQT